MWACKIRSIETEASQVTGVAKKSSNNIFPVVLAAISPAPPDETPSATKPKIPFSVNKRPLGLKAAAKSSFLVRMPALE